MNGVSTEKMPNKSGGGITWHHKLQPENAVAKTDSAMNGRPEQWIVYVAKSA
jgi:hypothetical protein